MNSFEKYYEDSPAYDSYRVTARDAYIAGLRRAADIANGHTDPEYVTTISEIIEAEANEIDKKIG